MVYHLQFDKVSVINTQIVYKSEGTSSYGQHTYWAVVVDGVQDSGRKPGTIAPIGLRFFANAEDGMLPEELREGCEHRLDLKVRLKGRETKHRDTGNPAYYTDLLIEEWSVSQDPKYGDAEDWQA